MIRYLKYIKQLFSKEGIKSEDAKIEGHDSYICEEDCSCTLELRLDKKSADFNVIVNVIDRDSQTAETLGLLLYLLNSGNLSEYMTNAYTSWAEDDPDKQHFIGEMFLSWLSNKESFSEEYDRLAVKPSNVFKMNG